MVHSSPVGEADVEQINNWQEGWKPGWRYWGSGSCLVRTEAGGRPQSLLMPAPYRTLPRRDTALAMAFTQQHLLNCHATARQQVIQTQINFITQKIPPPPALYG